MLIMDDPDATRRTITHWLVYDIPDYVRELPCNDDEIGIPGRNDFQCTGYSGPCRWQTTSRTATSSRFSPWMSSR